MSLLLWYHCGALRKPTVAIDVHCSVAWCVIVGQIQCHCHFASQPAALADDRLSGE